MADLGTVYMGNEHPEWKRALEDYMFENPTDWIARWLYGGMDTGMWEESMYADILREWYGELPDVGRDLGMGLTPADYWWRYRTPPGGRQQEQFLPEPAWMSELGLIAERGEDIRGPRIGVEEGDYGWRRPTPIYATAPGQAEALRPLGAQADLTTEQLDELMYYLAYTKEGRPESRKEYLQTVAYKMPGWIQDYISESRATWPTVTPPRAVTRPAWQR